MVGVLKSISSANPYRNVQVWPSARVVDSVLWGINLPLKNTTLFLASPLPLFNIQTVPAPPPPPLLLDNPHSILPFCEHPHPLKVRFFGELP